MSARSSGVVEAMRESAIGPYEPLAKATDCVGGLAGRLAIAFGLRNEDPEGAQWRLVEAMAAWPIVCRVMAELEAAYPDHAAQGAAKAGPLLDGMDRRDRKGDYA
ncbi:MAG: hypothetical protein JHC96_05640 [Brevundimonas sp.]|uniref:hypothetical protein n=1 Tax=Brevundimonas sp. TaxID=1871086 RepID=UPI001A306187|nr:hypothetical protein [Brevundimonas sp.]MBJ7318261.1 hypothetical protein [Brevundimonas sp.]